MKKVLLLAVVGLAGCSERTIVTGPAQPPVIINSRPNYRFAPPPVCPAPTPGVNVQVNPQCPPPARGGINIQINERR